VGILAIVLLVAAVLLVVGAEWPRLMSAVGADARQVRSRRRRKEKLTVVKGDGDDDFAASVLCRAKAWASGGAFSVTTTSTFAARAAGAAARPSSPQIRRPRLRSEIVRVQGRIESAFRKTRFGISSTSLVIPAGKDRLRGGSE
jgi:hypothetical protein